MARERALKVLIEYRLKGAWPNVLLKRQLEGLGPEDAGLVTAICYGVMQQRMLIDFYLAHYSTIKLGKIMPQVLDILRIGVYQLLFMDRVPAFAVVDESVKLAKKHGGFRAGGYVNALLRKIDALRDTLPTPNSEDREDYLSVVYSHPRWFVSRMTDILGTEGCEALLKANNALASPVARVNTAKISAHDLLELFAKTGITARRHEYLPDAIAFDSLRGVADGAELGRGLMYIMDTASQLCVHALSPAPEARVIDLCAAPGGKSLLAAQLMDCKGKILAIDVHPGKADALALTAENYGFENIIDTAAVDASQPISGLKASADYIICDVPCSGFGIIRKKPDIRYNSPDRFTEIQGLQAAILARAGEYLKPGGVMVYSTCTVFPEENQMQVNNFLAGNPAFKLEAFTLPGIGKVAGGMIMLYPHIHGTDGFFIARIRKLTDD